MKEVMIKMGNRSGLLLFWRQQNFCIFGLMGFLGNLDSRFVEQENQESKIINNPKHHRSVEHFLGYSTSWLSNQFWGYLQKFYE